MIKAWLNRCRVAWLRFRAERLLPQPWAETDAAEGMLIESVTVGHLHLQVYRPQILAGKPRAICYFHGGGFVAASLKSNHPMCADLARRLQAVVIAVAYRRAPEHPFPAAAEDALAAVAWCLEQRQRIGANSLYVAGDSAGGNLAAVSALHFGRQLAGQILVYPVIRYYDPPTPSYLAFAEGKGLSRAMMIWFWDNYLQDKTQLNNPRAFPLSATPELLTGAPPCLLLTAAEDVLHDEGREYAETLKQHGVDVEYHCFADAQHGFFGFAGPEGNYLNACALIQRWLTQVEQQTIKKLPQEL